MELRQLVYTEAVERHRHFTRAADELHVAQSALSQQIRKLEAELGTQLFERTSRRVIPTEAGEVVAARARRVLAEVDGVRSELDELRGLVRGRLAIGALLPAGALDVTVLLARFSRAFPGIEVGLREGTAAEMLALVEADALDLTFCLLVGRPAGVDGGDASERGGGRDRLSAGNRSGEAVGDGRRPRVGVAGDAAVGVGDQAGRRRALRRRRRVDCGSRSRAATPT